MDYKNFSFNIQSVIDVWPQSFNEGRIKVIWKIVQFENDHWFKKVCNDFVIHNKTAPLPHDFQEAVRIKNRSAQAFKLSPNEVHPAENSVFSSDEIREMMLMTKKRLAGELTYEELEAYKQVVISALKAKGIPYHE